MSFPKSDEIESGQMRSSKVKSAYDRVSANVMISVQKMGESESGQIVF